MNQDKARDLFSAYHDGSLEPGLRQQFERALSMDAKLKADYAAFSQTMLQLGQLQFEEIEIPIYLSDRIATRLEAEEQKRKTPVGAWSTWLRSLIYGSLATAAVASAVFAMQTGGGTAEAGIIGEVPIFPAKKTSKSQLPLNLLVFKAENGKVFLEYRTDRNQSVKVSSLSGKLIQQFSLNRNSLMAPLSNEFANTALLQVSAGTGDNTAIVALPGSSRTVAKTGGGTIYDFAAAIATKYGVPLVIRAPQGERFSWTLEAESARTAVESGLAGKAFSVDQRDGGLLTILPN